MNSNERHWINWHYTIAELAELDSLLGKLPSRTHYPQGPREEQRGQEDDGLLLRDLPIKEES